MQRITQDIAAFDYEVMGNSEPCAVSAFVGAIISAQLWEQHGAGAQWSDLDVDQLLDCIVVISTEFQAGLHTTLMGLLTWLANNGHLEPSRAQAMLARLQLREPPEVTQLRAAAAEWPDEVHTGFEQRRLERLARLRERKSGMN